MRVIGWLLLGLLALLAAYCLLLAVSALLVRPEREYPHDSPFYRWLLDSSVRLAVPILRIRMDIQGLEQLPQDTPVFFVGNHRSNFDPILTWYALRKYRIGFLSKAENFRIPIYGRIIRRCGCTAIDRENPRNAVVTIRAAAGRLQAAEGSVGAYPEGTRNKAADGLLPFHNGLFKAAKWAHAPIAVLALDGAEKVAKNYPLHSTRVTLRVAGVLTAEEVDAMSTAEIGARVRALLEAALPSTQSRACEGAGI